MMKRVKASAFAKFIAFLLFLVSSVLACGGAIGVLFMLEYDGISKASHEVIRERMVSEMWNYAGAIQDSFANGEMKEAETWLERNNIFAQIYKDEELLYSSYDGFETPYAYTFYLHTFMPDTEKQEKLTYYLYVDPEFPYSNKLSEIREQVIFIYSFFDYFLIAFVVGASLTLLCYFFLLCSAGHRKGTDEIAESLLAPIHSDVILAGFLAITIAIASMLVHDSELSALIINGILFLTVVALFGFVSMECAVRFKKNQFWKHTLIGSCFHLIAKGGRAGIHLIGEIWKNIPTLWSVLFAFGVIFLADIFVIDNSYDRGVLMLWCVGRLVLFAVFIYLALVWSRLKAGGRALAKGELDYKTDTSKMILGFKECGENLNRIGDGIAIQVEQRMKSEHLKTELITNVSHDIKTPLTSIINYADLIGTLVESDEQLKKNDTLEEYSEVLVRQSKRLKKLLEDLVEASKATTGNLEVDLKECEVGVILSQAVGEYGQRFEEKKLELIERQPQEPVRIMADGRHLWRVFDNLLNNICKYAKDDTRVYLTVEKSDKEVRIIFRNMSEYPLELTGEELQERFVRGDKSRHMEGSGLGLSIAGSLMELQQGKMEIITAGDLFKVVLTFANQK
jgi:signal transduction histidine kinase